MGRSRITRDDCPLRADLGNGCLGYRPLLADCEGCVYCLPVIPCSECGRQMVSRANRETGEEFLGCSGYPQCRATRPLPESVRLRRAGARMLPGLE